MTVNLGVVYKSGRFLNIKGTTLGRKIEYGLKNIALEKRGTPVEKPLAFLAGRLVSGFHNPFSSRIDKASDPLINPRTLGRLSYSGDPLTREAAAANLANRWTTKLDLLGSIRNPDGSIKDGWQERDARNFLLDWREENDLAGKIFRRVAGSVIKQSLEQTKTMSPGYVLYHPPSLDNATIWDSIFKPFLTVPGNILKLGTLSWNKTTGLKAAAEKPGTPSVILELLAMCDIKEVQEAALKNPNTPVEILRIQAENEDWHIRDAVAQNPSTPDDILEKLSEDENEYVRLDALRNPSTPLFIVLRQENDEDWRFRLAFVRHQKAPSWSLAIKSRDKDWRVRREVPLHPNTQLFVVVDMLGDEALKVRETARKVLETALNPLINTLKMAAEKKILENVRFAERK